MSVQKETKLELTIPTAFPTLNQQEGKDLTHERTSLIVKRLKLKHILEMQHMSEEQQMFQAITILTGLTKEDMAELDATDAAKLTTIVYDFMADFLKLAHKMADEK